MIASVGEGTLAVVGCLSMIKFTVKRIFWVRSHHKLLVKLQATRRGYNIEHSHYTIPEQERHHP